MHLTSIFAFVHLGISTIMLYSFLELFSKRGMSWNGEIGPFSFSETKERHIEMSCSGMCVHIVNITVRYGTLCLNASEKSLYVCFVATLLFPSPPGIRDLFVRTSDSDIAI